MCRRTHLRDFSVDKLVSGASGDKCLLTGTKKGPSRVPWLSGYGIQHRDRGQQLDREYMDDHIPIEELQLEQQ